MNTSPASILSGRAAMLLALALATTPLLARQDAVSPADPTAAPMKSKVGGGGGAGGGTSPSGYGYYAMDPNTGLLRAEAPYRRATRGPTLRATSGRQLLVPAADTSPERLGGLREELAIMSRLFAKAADPEGGKRDAFRFNFGGLGLGQGSDLDALYLDGYGAVFLLDVDHPLVEPPKAGEKAPEAKADQDAAWEKARRELAGEDHDDAAKALVDPNTGIANLSFDDQDAPAFDADKVAALRKRLTEAFRHAANLKSVKGDEHIVVVVSGRAAARTVRVGGNQVTVHNVVGYVTSGNGFQPFDPQGRGTDARHQLTLRAKKSDVDALARGSLSREEFAQRITVSVQEEAVPAGSPPRQQRLF